MQGCEPPAQIHSQTYTGIPSDTQPQNQAYTETHRKSHSLPAHHARRLGLLAFDIETTGLNPATHVVTAACVFGEGAEETFLFKGESEADDARSRERFLALLDAAPRLCAFNGIRFDIPFLHTAWGVPAERVEGWVLKTFDVYEACKLGLNATFSLNRLLSANGLESKSGSGLHAITLAHSRQWDALGAYCMQDTRLTYLATLQDSIALPVLSHASKRQIVIDRTTRTLFRVW